MTRMRHNSWVKVLGHHLSFVARLAGEISVPSAIERGDIDPDRLWKTAVKAMHGNEEEAWTLLVEVLADAQKSPPPIWLKNPTTQTQLADDIGRPNLQQVLEQRLANQGTGRRRAPAREYLAITGGPQTRDRKQSRTTSVERARGRRGAPAAEFLRELKLPKSDAEVALFLRDAIAALSAAICAARYLGWFDRRPTQPDPEILDSLRVERDDAILNAAAGVVARASSPLSSAEYAQLATEDRAAPQSEDASMVVDITPPKKEKDPKVVRDMTNKKLKRVEFELYGALLRLARGVKLILLYLLGRKWRHAFAGATCAAAVYLLAPLPPPTLAEVPCERGATGCSQPGNSFCHPDYGFSRIQHGEVPPRDDANILRCECADSHDPNKGVWLGRDDSCDAQK